MAHGITFTEYKELRDKTFSIISFDENNKRASSYMGLTAAKLVKELVSYNCPVVILSDDNRLNWDNQEEGKMGWDRELMRWETANHGRITLEKVLELKKKYRA
jgi:hypothetical protein